jgi:prolyl-tRNA synthetase
VAAAEPRPTASQPLTKLATPGARTIADLCAQLKIGAAQCAKTLLVDGVDGDVIALVIRGDHELNAIKAEKLPGVARPMALAGAERVRAATGSEPGYLGPIGFKGKVFVDHAAAHMSDFVCGANERDMHFTGVNWGRDLAEPESVDIRNAQAGDPSPTGRGRLQLARGIEVGHIFQLGRLYSEAMHASVLDEAGKALTMFMGCYGIGITRVVAAAIEQNHDANGIIWPQSLAPFQVVLVPINYQKSTRVTETTDALYQAFNAAGIDVLLDDRDARPGVKFADSELLGIPHRLVIGERTLSAGKLEYRQRRETESTEISAEDPVSFIRHKLDA